MPDCLPHLQERAAEHANEASRARDGQLLLRKAAAGGYGGGSGPLRDAAGRAITVLNPARLLDAALFYPMHAASRAERVSLKETFCGG